MARKPKNHLQMSLFSFQDVMASVIGVLFFVVLLMSVEIVEKASDSLDDRQPNETVKAELDAQIQALNNRRHDILKAIKVLEKQIIIVSAKDDQSLLSEISQCERNLKVLYSQLEQKQVSTNELLEKIEDNKKRYSEKVRQCDESERRISNLKAQLAEQMNVPSVSYIIDGKLDMTPWLIEFTGNTIRVASHDMAAIVEFNASDHRSREQLFTAWAKTRDTRSEYFVILIKPSGWDAYENSFMSRIIELGFDIGTDLIPEDKRVF